MVHLNPVTKQARNPGSSGDEQRLERETRRGSAFQVSGSARLLRLQIRLRPGQA